MDCTKISLLSLAQWAHIFTSNNVYQQLKMHVPVFASHPIVVCNGYTNVCNILPKAVLHD